MDVTSFLLASSCCSKKDVTSFYFWERHLSGPILRIPMFKVISCWIHVPLLNNAPVTSRRRQYNHWSTAVVHFSTRQRSQYNRCKHCLLFLFNAINKSIACQRHQQRRSHHRCKDSIQHHCNEKEKQGTNVTHKSYLSWQEQTQST
jgi:hypothetical protein